MSKGSYEVETQTYCDGWVNTWTSDDETQYFETPGEAFTALADFFDTLAAAGMANQYDPEEYRVVEVST